MGHDEIVRFESPVLLQYNRYHYFRFRVYSDFVVKFMDKNYFCLFYLASTKGAETLISTDAGSYAEGKAKVKC